MVLRVASRHDFVELFGERRPGRGHDHPLLARLVVLPTQLMAGRATTLSGLLLSVTPSCRSSIQVRNSAPSAAHLRAHNCGSLGYASFQLLVLGSTSSRRCS